MSRVESAANPPDSQAITYVTADYLDQRNKNSFSGRGEETSVISTLERTGTKGSRKLYRTRVGDCGFPETQPLLCRTAVLLKSPAFS